MSLTGGVRTQQAGGPGQTLQRSPEDPANGQSSPFSIQFVFVYIHLHLHTYVCNLSIRIHDVADNVSLPVSDRLPMHTHTPSPNFKSYETHGMLHSYTSKVYSLTDFNVLHHHHHSQLQNMSVSAKRNVGSFSSQTLLVLNTCSL